MQHEAFATAQLAAASQCTQPPVLTDGFFAWEGAACMLFFLHACCSLPLAAAVAAAAAPAAALSAVSIV